MTDVDRRITAGMAAQARQRDRLWAEGSRRVGWKAGFGTHAAMAKLAIEAPLVGYLTGGSLLPGGSECSIAHWDTAMLEPELAVRLGRDLGGHPDAGEVLEAIDGVAPAIELVELPQTSDDVETILAANIYHRHFLLGEFCALEPATARLDVVRNGEEHARDVDPAALLGSPLDILAGVATTLNAVGERLQAGDVVITGSAVPALAVVPSDRVTVRLGSADVTVSLG